MGDRALPEDVEQLIVERIESVAHLEALLLLRAPPEDWSVAAVAKRLYITEPQAAGILAQLRRHGFLSAGRSGEDFYRYRPTSLSLARRVDRLAETYRTRLIPVTNLIHEKSGRSAPEQVGDVFHVSRDD